MTDNQKKISILTPCYNSEKHLAEALASIEEQTMPIDELEIILINDNSNLKTVELLEELKKL